MQTRNINDFLLRPKTWLQMARTLISVAVAVALRKTNLRNSAIWESKRALTSGRRISVSFFPGTGASGAKP